jgi:hypothetical protein
MLSDFFAIAAIVETSHKFIDKNYDHYYEVDASEDKHQDLRSQKSSRLFFQLIDLIETKIHLNYAAVLFFSAFRFEFEIRCGVYANFDRCVDRVHWPSCLYFIDQIVVQEHFLLKAFQE